MPSARELIFADREVAYCPPYRIDPVLMAHMESQPSAVLSMPGLLAAGNVLDLGAGKLRNSEHLAQQGFNVTAFDQDPLKHALHDNITTVKADLRAAQLPPAANMILIYTARFLHKNEGCDLLRRMREATRPGGVHVIEDLLSLPGLRQSEEPERWFAPEEVAELYRDAGWIIRHCMVKEIDTVYVDARGERVRSHAGRVVAKAPR